MAIRLLSPALQKKAEEELNETPERVKTDLQALREWLQHQPHLHLVEPSDQWLVSFLRGCKYNIEKTQGKIDMHYTLKATVPEFYANRDPLDPGMQDILNLGVFLPLRKCVRDDSPKIMLLRVAQMSKITRTMSELAKLSLMMVEILLAEDDNFSIAGEDLIIDCKDISFSLLWQWTPSLAKKVTYCSEKALSVRLKSVHILNAPFFIAPAVAIFKMFLGAKIKDRIHLHTKDCDTLYDHISKSVLPEEYGGTDGTLEELTAYWKARVESHRDSFLQDSCSDESMRTNETNSG